MVVVTSNDLSLSKDTVRRHRNSMREQRAKFILELNLEIIHDLESNRYLLQWDGIMPQSIEHVGTFKEVIAILLTATHEKSEIFFIKNLDLLPYLFTNCLEVAISGSPVFHIKVGRPIKCLAYGHNK